MPEVVNVFGYQLTGMDAKAATFAGFVLLGLIFAALVMVADAVNEEFRNDFGSLSDRRRQWRDDGGTGEAGEGE